VVSQNFTSGVYTSANSAAADDFVVPSGQTWRVTGVDVAGGCFYGGSCAEQVTSEIVTFYRNRRGHPSPRIKKQYTLTCSQASNNFACTIPGKGVRFRAGRHYWVSFVVNC